MRRAEIARKTKETDIRLKLSLDGGEIAVDTGIGFFDHMLTAFAFHGGFGLELAVTGDLQVDGHHTVEDTGLALGQAFDTALGDRRGIARFASAHIPMDEALAFCAADIGGRPFLVFDAAFPQARVGEYDACMTGEFMRALATNARMTLHLRAERGENSHHMVEALFKAAGRALRAAVRIEGDAIPSTKGTL